MLGQTGCGVYIDYIKFLLQQKSNRQICFAFATNLLASSLKNAHIHSYLLHTFREVLLTKIKHPQNSEEPAGFDHLSSIDSGDNADDIDEGEVLEAL